MEKKTDFKALSNKAKVQYVWDYYRWPIIGVIIAVAFVGSVIHHYVTYREPLLNVIMTNCSDPFSADDSGYDEFLAAYGYDADESPISLLASLSFPEENPSSAYNDYQVLATMVAAGEQDLFFGTGEAFLNYAEQGALLDLSTVLPAEILKQYEDHLVYSTDAGESEPYPCAIELTDNEWVKKNNYYSSSCYFGIFYRNQNLEACKQFAEFLLTY